MKDFRRPFAFIPPLGPPPSTAKERVLAQWRRVNLAPLEEVGRPTKNAGDMMRRVMQELRMDSRLKETEIVRVWNQLLAPDIAAHSQPVGLVRGTLFVDVDSSVWLEEIVRWRKREMLERLQHSFGRTMIQRISFRLG